jgi:hypothetical protein
MPSVQDTAYPHLKTNLTPICILNRNFEMLNLPKFLRCQI